MLPIIPAYYLDVSGDTAYRRGLRRRAPLVMAGVMALALAFWAIGATTVGAELIVQEVVNVPVTRLVRNLERLISENPKEIKHRVNLARVHVMAYALKSDRIKVNRRAPDDGPVTELLKENVQPSVKETNDAEARREARHHLTSVIARYEEALTLDPKHALALLGYGWALQQSGAKERAIAAYRAAIERSWPQEFARNAFLEGWRSITEEAAGYLIPLLDPVTDRDEIRLLRDRQAQIDKMPRAITPIVIPLRDGLAAADLVDESAAVPFDADGSGRRRRWTWLTPHAGILVWMPTKARAIDSALQWFGNVTFWLFWDNGYEALRALDDDGDGGVRGEEIHGMALWRDANGDGRSEPHEVRPLQEWGIVELRWRYSFDESHPYEIPFSSSGVVFSDGSTRPTYDVLLRRR